MNRAQLIALAAAILTAGSNDPNTGETYTPAEAIYRALTLADAAERQEQPK